MDGGDIFAGGVRLSKNDKMQFRNRVAGEE